MSLRPAGEHSGLGSAKREEIIRKIHEDNERCRSSSSAKPDPSLWNDLTKEVTRLEYAVMFEATKEELEAQEKSEPFFINIADSSDDDDDDAAEASPEASPEKAAEEPDHEATNKEKTTKKKRKERKGPKPLKRTIIRDGIPQHITCHMAFFRCLELRGLLPPGTWLQDDISVPAMKYQIDSIEEHRKALPTEEDGKLQFLDGISLASRYLKKAPSYERLHVLYAEAIAKNANKDKDGDMWWNFGRSLRDGEKYVVEGVLYDETLCQHKAVEIDPNAFEAWNNLGMSFWDDPGRVIEINGETYGEDDCYRESIRANPTYHFPWLNLAHSCKGKDTKLVQGKRYTATQLFEKALGYCPTAHSTWNDLGIRLKGEEEVMVHGKFYTKQECYAKALSICPTYHHCWNNVAPQNNDGKVEVNGKLYGRIECYLEALKVEPNYDVAYRNIGLSLGDNGKITIDGVEYTELSCFAHSVRCNPKYACGWNSLGTRISNASTDKRDVEIMGKKYTSRDCYLAAIYSDPNYEYGWANLGVELEIHGGTQEVFGTKMDAAACYRHALTCNPSYKFPFSRLAHVTRGKAEVDNVVGGAVFTVGEMLAGVPWSDAI